MQIEGDEPDFDSVFAREDVKESHDSEAAPVASEARPRDEAGRFTSLHGTPVEEAPPTTEPAKEAAPTAETPPQASQPETTDAAQSRMIPLPELLGERQKRQEAERRMAELQGQLQAFQQMAHQQRAPQQPQEDQQPDWFASPEQAAQVMQSRFEQQMFQTRVALSEELLKQQHKDYDEVSALFAEHAKRDPGLLQQVFNHPTPAHYAYQVGKQIQFMSKIGSDPDSYEKRVREEERNKVLAELKAGGINAGQPKPVFPGSLASATPTGRQGGHMDPQSAADSVFARRG